MFRDFITGAAYPFKATSFIFKNPRLLKFILIPFAISLAVFGSAVYVFFSNLDELLTYLPAADAWYGAVIYWVVAVLASLLFFLIAFFLCLILANIIAAPFNELLSARVEQILHDNQLQLPKTSILKSIVRAITVESKKFLIFLIAVIPIFLIGLIPVVGQILSSVLFYFYVCYALTFTFTDYAMERELMKFREKSRTVLSRKSLMLGFGSICFAIGLVPFSNFFVIPVFVVAGTLMYHEKIKPKENPPKA